MRRKTFGALLNRVATKPPTVTVRNLSYTWVANKNKTSESIGVVMRGYGFTSAGTVYDDEDRLTGFARASGSLTQSWKLSPVGDWNSITTNGTAQSRTHGPTHELLTAGSSSVTKDVLGNITNLPLPLGEGPGEGGTGPFPLAIAWDFDNKLKSVDVGNDIFTDVKYRYDALDRRAARIRSSDSYVYVKCDKQTIADYGVGFEFEVASAAYEQVTGEVNATLTLNHFYDMLNKRRGYLCAGPHSFALKPPFAPRCATNLTNWLLGYGCAPYCEPWRPR